MNSPFTSIISTPAIDLGITIENDYLINTEYLYKKPNQTIKPITKLEQELAKQLKAYFSDSKYRFDLPLKINATPFQTKVLKALQKIKPGTVKTYGELAKELNTSARAIGNACRNNPLPLIIPCHRIVAKNSLGGFSGAIKGQKIDLKTWLLRHEGYL